MRINYLLLGIVAFFGLIIGIVIALMAKEELKAGRKYFLLLQKILFLAIIVLTLKSLQLQPLVRLITYIVTIVAVLLNFSTKIIYPLLAIALFLTNDSRIAMLTFIYGLPTAAIIIEEKIKESNRKIAAEIIVSHLTFLIILLILAF